MTQGLITAAYIVAAAFFIASLAGLSQQETARRGNWLGILGMTIALLATIAGVSMDAMLPLLIALAIGGAIGLRLALKVEMTQIPEMVALFNGFGGLASLGVALSDHFLKFHVLNISIVAYRSILVN